MKDQINTIRTALTKRGWATEKEAAEALTALTQLEAMAGEQKPVAYAIFAENGNIRLWSTESQHVKRIAQEKGLSLVPLYASPVAQQPQYDQTALELCAVCGWKTLIPGDCCLNCERNKAQQPQAECRSDGRCQYAIDHGAEGLGHCPEGKCAMKQPQAEVAEVFYCKTCGTAMQMPHDDCLACERGERQQPQAEAGPPDVVRDADVEAAAKKMAEIFDYPWDFMPEKGRNTMRENVRAVLGAAMKQGGGV